MNTITTINKKNMEKLLVYYTTMIIMKIVNRWSSLSPYSLYFYHKIEVNMEETVRRKKGYLGSKTGHS